MERNSASLRLGVEHSVFSEGHAASMCSACGEEFDRPLSAMVFSDSLVEKYYACPTCLSKVDSVGCHKDFEADESDEDKANVSAVAEAADALEDPPGCTHHPGYLKERPKNTPIPEECLTCSKMIECMY
jgi:DNA-directed RNA polymerase subunit RPC12/RpoP